MAAACETCSAAYVNNDMQALQDCNRLPGDYEQLMQGKSEQCAASVDTTGPFWKCSVQGLQQDGQSSTRCGDFALDALARSAAGFGLSTAVTDGNRDSGYVQHDEWLSQVIGIGS
jgi:hypothetical protein